MKDFPAPMTFTFKHLTFLAAVFFITAYHHSHAQAQTNVDFESLPVPGSGFFNGDVNGGSPYRDNFSITGTRDNFGSVETLQLWNQNQFQFFNGYTEDFTSWNGFSWSNVMDTSTAGFGNQYASFAGGGSDGMGGSDSGTYAMAFNSSFFNLPDRATLTSIDLTNGTYPAIIMRDGDPFNFAKQFGGDTGDDEDLFSVTLTAFDAIGGINGDGNAIGSVDHILADYRFADNSLDFIQDDWATVDLSALSGAKSVEVSFFSTDSGTNGINTPIYVAVDNIRYQITPVPEPNSLTILVLAGASLLVRRRRN